MRFRKHHLFFGCGIMKFFLILVFVLLLFDENQGSTLSRKRIRRGLNTTLQTNFNGTYQRRNPCNNAEIETSSYAASHEFHHHTVEDNWTDYTSKCGAIINGFLHAIGNLFRFNNDQHGIFNFHINTSITHNQDGVFKSKENTPCEAFPTITIEASNCEPCPKSIKAVVAIQNKNSAHSKSKCEEEDEESETIANSLQGATTNILREPVKSSQKNITEEEFSTIPLLSKNQLSFSSNQDAPFKYERQNKIQEENLSRFSFKEFPQDITTASPSEPYGSFTTQFAPNSLNYPQPEYNVATTPGPLLQQIPSQDTENFGYNENAELGPNTEPTLPRNFYENNQNFMGNQYQGFQKANLVPGILEQPLDDQQRPTNQFETSSNELTQSNDFTPKRVQLAEILSYSNEPEMKFSEQSEDLFNSDSFPVRPQNQVEQSDQINPLERTPVSPVRPNIFPEVLDNAPNLKSQMTAKNLRRNQGFSFQNNNEAQALGRVPHPSPSASRFNSEIFTGDYQPQFFPRQDFYNSDVNTTQNKQIPFLNSRQQFEEQKPNTNDFLPFASNRQEAGLNSQNPNSFQTQPYSEPPTVPTPGKFSPVINAETVPVEFNFQSPDKSSDLYSMNDDIELETRKDASPVVPSEISSTSFPNQNDFISSDEMVGEENKSSVFLSVPKPTQLYFPDMKNQVNPPSFTDLRQPALNNNLDSEAQIPNLSRNQPPNAKNFRPARPSELFNRMNYSSKIPSTYSHQSNVNSLEETATAVASLPEPESESYLGFSNYDDSKASNIYDSYDESNLSAPSVVANKPSLTSTQNLTPPKSGEVPSAENINSEFSNPRFPFPANLNQPIIGPSNRNFQNEALQPFRGRISFDQNKVQSQPNVNSQTFSDDSRILKASESLEIPMFSPELKMPSDELLSNQFSNNSKTQANQFLQSQTPNPPVPSSFNSDVNDYQDYSLPPENLAPKKPFLNYNLENEQYNINLQKPQQLNTQTDEQNIYPVEEVPLSSNNYKSQLQFNSAQTPTQTGKPPVAQLGTGKDFNQPILNFTPNEENEEETSSFDPSPQQLSNSDFSSEQLKNFDNQYFRGFSAPSVNARDNTPPSDRPSFNEEMAPGDFMQPEEIPDNREFKANPAFSSGKFNVPQMSHNKGPEFFSNQNGPEYENWSRPEENRPLKMTGNFNEENQNLNNENFENRERQMKMDKLWIPEPQEMNTSNENERPAEIPPFFDSREQPSQQFGFSQSQTKLNNLGSESLVSIPESNPQFSNISTPNFNNFQTNKKVGLNNYQISGPPFSQFDYPTQNQQNSKPPSVKWPLLENIPLRPQPEYESQIQNRKNRPFSPTDTGNLPPFNQFPVKNLQNSNFLGKKNEVTPVSPSSQYQEPNRFPEKLSLNPQNHLISSDISQGIVQPDYNKAFEMNNKRTLIQSQVGSDTQPPHFDIMNEQPNMASLTQLGQTESNFMPTQASNYQNENSPPEDYDYNMNETPPPPSQVNSENIPPQYFQENSKPLGPERRGFLPLIPENSTPQEQIRTFADSMESEFADRERGRKFPIIMNQTKRPGSFTAENTQEIMGENINTRNNLQPDLDYFSEEEEQQQQPPTQDMVLTEQSTSGLNNRFMSYQNFPENVHDLERKQSNIRLRNFESMGNPTQMEETYDFPPQTQSALNNEVMNNQHRIPDSLRIPQTFNRNIEPNVRSKNETSFEEEEITANYPRLPESQIETQVTNVEQNFRFKDNQQFMDNQAESESESEVNLDNNSAASSQQNPEQYTVSEENRLESLLSSETQIPNAFTQFQSEPQFFQNERQAKPFLESESLSPASFPKIQSDYLDIDEQTKPFEEAAQMQPVPNPLEGSKIKTTETVEEFITDDYPRAVNNPEIPSLSVKNVGFLEKTFTEKRHRVSNNQPIIFYPNNFNIQQVGPSLSNSVSLTNFELRRPENEQQPPELGLLLASQISEPSPSEHLKQHSEKIVKALADKNIFERQKTIFFEEKYSHAHPETSRSQNEFKDGTDIPLNLQGQNFQTVNTQLNADDSTARDVMAFSDSHALVSDQTTPSNKPDATTTGRFNKLANSFPQNGMSTVSTPGRLLSF